MNQNQENHQAVAQQLLNDLLQKEARRDWLFNMVSAQSQAQLLPAVALRLKESVHIHAPAIA